MGKAITMRDQLDRLIKKAFNKELYERFMLYMLINRDIPRGVALLKSFINSIEPIEDKKTIERFEDLRKYLENM